MKILVPLKRVADPDNANKVKIPASGEKIETTGLEWKPNPFDEYALEAALRRPFERIYVAGSSSGAYFVTALALGGGFEADGWAALSGGARDVRTGGAKRPFYVGYGAADPTNAGPKALGAFLKAEGWPVRVSEHPGGHGAREVYLVEALEHWAAAEAP